MVADVRGPVTLTVPIAKPYASTWCQCRVSLHGRWNEVMWTALESAYGRTPYFEFFADDFRPLLQCGPEGFGSITELNTRFDRTIRHCLGIDLPVTYSEVSDPSAPEEWSPAPYWQVRQHKLGFIPGLSILDMLFNLGRETLMYL